MAGIKTSLLPTGAVPSSADLIPSVQGGVLSQVTMSQLRQFIGEGLTARSPSTVTAGYAADTYLAGSGLTIPGAGGWKAGTIYRCKFDMVKTAAGVAALVITVRLGTLGTTGDAAIYTFTFGAGTAAADTGIFDLFLAFRTVGAGSAAVVAGAAECRHHLAATGLVSTGAAGIGIITPGASAGFDSTTQTKIGVSVNGGAAFSGTNTIVAATADNV